MGDSSVCAAKKPTDGVLTAPMRDKLDTAARSFADELANSDFSVSKNLSSQVKKYESDEHLSPTAGDYLARRIAADNSADRLNAEQQAQQKAKETHWYDRLKGLVSNDQLEKKGTLPKVILSTNGSHAEISGVIADALPEHQLLGETPAATAKPASAPEPYRNPNADYPNTALGQEHAFTDTLNLNKSK
jgi:hypothetical protein